MTLAVASSDRSLTRHRDTSESVLETARLTIRRMGRGDVARIFAITSRLDELDLSASALDEAGLEELRERFEHEWQTFGMGYMIICREDDGESVGHIRLRWMADCVSGRAAELTYAIAPGFQNQGFATEAIGAVLRFAFATAGLDYVIACVEPENVASARVIEKNGMAKVAAGRVHYRQMHRYLLPQSMWRAQQQALAAADAADGS